MAKAPVSPAVGGVTPVDGPAHLYRLSVTIPQGQTFAQVVNITRLEQELKAALPGRVWSVKHRDNTDTIDVGAAPSTVFSTGEKATIVNAVTAHDPAQQSAEQIERAAREARLVAFKTYYLDNNASAVQTREVVKAMLLHLGLVVPDDV